MFRANNTTKAKNRRLSVNFPAFLAVAICFALIGCSLGMFLTQNAVAESTTDTAQKTSYAAVYSSDNPIPAIAEAVRPAVVQVINMVQTWDRMTGKVSTVEQAYGSGVYVDERGYILTNNHVVQGADAVEILTIDNQRMAAEIVGTDNGTDLAVLKVNEKINATPVPMGDSDALQVGELAICIGNPGAGTEVLFGTVTAGIISALDRENVNAQNFQRQTNVIQTDAAINSGNSGGAMLNAAGELIGIPTLKVGTAYSGYGEIGVYEGLGFAIPINTAKKVMADLIEHGKVIRPRLGINVGDNPGPDEALRNYPPSGIAVMGVEEGSPAEKAGMKKYDIITEINGVRVKNFTAMTAEIDKLQAGDAVKLVIYRYYDQEGNLTGNPERVELEVTLEILDT